MNKGISRLILLSGGVFACAGSGGIAHAQASESGNEVSNAQSTSSVSIPSQTLSTIVPSAKPAEVQDIIVTAQRREQRLQNVPIAVTALPTAVLERKQVVDVISLSKAVPGMHSQQTLSPAEISISIRGVSQLVPNVTIDPPIGVYVDGAYTAINAGSNAALIDMERVEVLKGPQGTLFGRNTIGGTVSITTAKPTNKLEGYVQATGGNYGAWGLTGVVNLPIVHDTLVARIVYQHSRHGGYGENRVTGAETATNEQDYLRGTIRYRPTEEIEALFTGSYIDSRGNAAPARLRYFDPAATLGPGLPPTNALYPALSGNPGDLMTNYIGKGGFYDSFSDLNDRYRLRQYNATATIIAHVGDSVSLKSITAYTHTVYDTQADIDGTPYKFLEFVNNPVRAKQFSEEIQAYGDLGKLSYIAGLYYFDERASQIGYGQVLTALAPTENVSGPFVRNRSYSGFGQLTYEIVPGLRLTGGVRYVVDTRQVNYIDHAQFLDTGGFAYCQLANQPFSPSEAACSYKRRIRYHYVPFTAGIDYRASPDILVYAKVSKGFRSGAFSQSGPAAIAPSATVTIGQAAAANQRALDEFGPAAPESALSPEIGAKFDLLDRRLRVNVAAYYTDYKNLQLSVNLPTDPGCPNCTVVSKLTNSGEAHIWGGEAEVTALIGAFQLDLSAGYTHPQYVQGPNVGSPIVNAPKFNGSATGTYPITFRAGTLSLSATYSYRSRTVFFSLSPGLPSSVYADVSQKGYGLLDARVSFGFKRLPATIAIFASNLTNKHYYVAASNFGAPLLFADAFPGVPRLIGGSLRIDF
ncbi:TonB-dependent receptor [Sphingobium sp. Sx8-8]|uniref:TonB-dependent receptor n=1 Tax=Sphingobium sp. Sx8-8 TaxID=2933617 RepID=UPI001F568FD5|nr:TonB-dependent receptor [Sphingobium sp. Sx8-8]